METYHAVFGEATSDSITQAVIKSQMPAELRTHLELETFTRTKELVSLMSSLSKMRTATTSPNAAALGPVPMEIGWVKNKCQGMGKSKEKGKGKGKSKGKGKEKPKSEHSRGGGNNFGKWSQSSQLLAWKKTVYQIKGKAGTASLSSPSSTLMATDVGTKEIGLIESVCEDAEMSWLCMVADSVAIKQLSMDGAHSLVVDSRAFVYVCSTSCATHRDFALRECWRGVDLRSASGKMLYVWGIREVVYNVMDLHGKASTVKIPFVVCEAQRPLLSLAMLEDKGFQLTVGDGCQKLGGHGREMILRRQGNSNLVDVEFRSGLLECNRTMLRAPPGLVAPVDSGLASLSATAVVEVRRAVTISTPKCPVVKLWSRTN